MIPLTLADEVQATLLDYLTTTVHFQDGQLEAALLDFLHQAPGGMFQGPYIQLHLPFRKAPAKQGHSLPLLYVVPFHNVNDRANRRRAWAHFEDRLK